MTNALTDAVRRLKGLQEEVERLKSGQDEAGEPRLFITEQEVALARDDIEIIAEDILAIETAVAQDSAPRLESEVIKSAFYNRSDAGYNTLEYSP